MKIRLAFVALSIFFLLKLSDSLAQPTLQQKYFEWTTLPFPKEEYKTRRDKMLVAINEQGGGIFICPSRNGISHGETYRELDDFMYFTGLEMPNSILVMDAETNQIILFVPPSDARFESPSRKNDFPGRPLLNDPDLKIKSGFVNIQSMALLDSLIKLKVAAGSILKINQQNGNIIEPLHTTYQSSWSTEEFLIYHLQQTFGAAKIKNAYAEVASLRMIKSPLEIQALRMAAAITIDGIKKAVAIVKSGVDERTLEGEMEAEFKRRGSARIGFASIIKSGPNSLWPWRILAAHYERRNRTMQDGELVIFDVGCEYQYYTSDMGRTFPVSGKFTNEQKQILKMETAVADAVIAAIKPGITFADLKRVADSAIPQNEKKYMQVGLHFGHHIGLSTGDPADANAKFVAGMVFTVEPWYYNHDRGIAVFTEDEIVVTEQGAEVLTKAMPRTPESLEAWMKKSEK